jgi:hypothetical protein
MISLLQALPAVDDCSGTVDPLDQRVGDLSGALSRSRSCCKWFSVGAMSLMCSREPTSSSLHQFENE